MFPATNVMNDRMMLRITVLNLVGAKFAGPVTHYIQFIFKVCFHI